MYLAATNFAGVVNKLIEQFQPVTLFLVGLALVYFLYGVSQVILNSGDEAKLTEGKKTMLWGILALFIMVSIWGLAGIAADTFGLKATTVNNSGYIQP